MMTINENFKMTEHCEWRAAQRGISEPVLDLVLKHGDVCDQKGDAALVSINRRQRKAILKDLKTLARALGKDKDIYAVIGGDGSVVTTGRQYRSIRHND